MFHAAFILQHYGLGRFGQLGQMGDMPVRDPLFNFRFAGGLRDLRSL